MASKKNLMDSQPQWVYGSVTLGAAGAAQLAGRIQFSTTVHQPIRQAVEILEVWFEPDLAVKTAFRGNAHFIRTAIQYVSESLVARNLNQAFVLALDEMFISADAAPAASNTVTYPRKMQLPPRDLDNRGLIVPPDNLWFFYQIAGANFAAITGTVSYRLYYRTHEIDADLATEMLQTLMAYVPVT